VALIGDAPLAEDECDEVVIMPAAVFLDRDGVLNEAVVRDSLPHAPNRLADLIIYPEAAGAIAKLKAAGYTLIVVTNQPDIGRGEMAREIVDAINSTVRAALPGIDDIRVCWHDDRDQCHCRKPKPGLILDAARDYGIDLSASFMVGDRWRDMDCGANAGVRTILVDRGWPERAPQHAPDFRVSNVAEAADVILGQ
jgi:D-glycero-D-manno-heptose 1,7-bisphosphate phosphatase